jgi:iron complex outermembrane receptor protein
MQIRSAASLAPIGAARSRWLELTFARCLTGFLFGALAVGLCPAARAQAAPTQPLADRIGEVTLFGEEELTIQALTRTDTPLSRAPGAVTVIGARQIRESGARTIPELLRLVAGVNVRWNPMVQTIDIRGFGQNPFTNRVLLLIDGVPYNSWNMGGLPHHPGFDFFVLQNVKRIEVVRGPGSALYGENAFWGVINIVSLSGEDLAGGKGELFAGDLDTRVAGVAWGKRLGEGSLLVSGRYVQGQFPMRFWFDENDSRVDGSDVFVKGKLRGLELSYYRHADSVDGFRESLEPELPGAFRSASTIAQHIDILALKYGRRLGGDRVDLGADLSYARRVGSHCAACHAAPQDERFVDHGVDHGYQAIADVRAAVRLMPSHEVLVGIEARDVDAGDHEEELADPSHPGAPPAFGYTKVAVYVQDQIALAGDRLQLVLGVRHDGGTDLFDAETSPRVALSWSPGPALVLRGGWSRAFRFPNFSERYQRSWFFNVDAGAFAFPLSVFSPNPELAPESIETVELGAERRLSPELSLKLDLFHSRIDDFIVVDARQPPPPAVGTIGFANHPASAEVAGGELELRWSRPDLASGFLSWSYERPQAGATPRGSPLPPLELVYAPRHKVNLASYFGPFGGVRGAVEAQWRDGYQAPAFWNLIRSGFTDASTARLPGYLLLDARVSYDLPVGRGRRGKPIRVSLHGRNLLDETPMETLVGVDGTIAGRTFFGGVELGF